jgi:hypothetical protein
LTYIINIYFKRQGMKKQHDGRRHMPQGDVKK